MSDVLGWCKANKQTTVIAISILSLILFGIGIYCVQRKDKSNSETIRRNCLSVDRNATIFICIPSYRDAFLADALVEMYSKAYCPLRIFIGVYMHGNDKEQAVEARFQQLLPKSSLVPQSNVRCIGGASCEALGSHRARLKILQHLYRSETYIIFVSDRTKFLNNFDELLFQNWHAVKKDHKKPVISTLPPDLGCALEDGSLTSLLAFKEEEVPPTFLKFAGFNKELNVPLTDSTLAARTSFAPSRALFVSMDCLFGLASDLIPAMETFPSPPYLRQVEDSLLSCYLFCQNFAFFSPTRSVVFRCAHKDCHVPELDFSRNIVGIQSDLRNVLAKLKTLNSIRPFSDFERHSGTNWESNTALERSALGLCSNPSQEEIEDKYGSLSNYWAILDKLSLALEVLHKD